MKMIDVNSKSSHHPFPNNF